LLGQEPDYWSFAVKLFGLRLADAAVLHVPVCSFEIQATYKSAIFWSHKLEACLLRCLKVEYFFVVVCWIHVVGKSELKLELVDLDCVLAGKVLEDRGQERLSEEEP